MSVVRTVLRTVRTLRTVTRNNGVPGTDAEGGGATTFAALTDKATADLPTINTPLSSALSGKAATSHTHLSAAITDATDAATPSTVVLRDGTGGASFATVTAGWIATSVFEANGNTGAISFDASAYTYGTGSASAHRTALGSGATGDALFTAATPAAARTTLGLATTDRPLFAGLDITYTGSTYAIDATKTGGSRFGVYLGDTSSTQIGTFNNTKLALTTLGNSRMEISSGGAVTISNSLTVGGFLATTPATRSGPGALSVTASSIALTTTGVADALTLANGTNGQILTVCHVSRGGGTGTAVLTPTTKNGYATITFTATGDSVTLQYHTTGGWHIVGSRGVTIA